MTKREKFMWFFGLILLWNITMLPGLTRLLVN